MLTKSPTPRQIPYSWEPHNCFMQNNNAERKIIKCLIIVQGGKHISNIETMIIFLVFSTFQAIMEAIYSWLRIIYTKSKWLKKTLYKAILFGTKEIYGWTLLSKLKSYLTIIITMICSREKDCAWNLERNWPFLLNQSIHVVHQSV